MNRVRHKKKKSNISILMEHAVLRYETLMEHAVLRYETLLEHAVFRYETLMEHAVLRYETATPITHGALLKLRYESL